MNVSPDSVRALERHFVGALSSPSRLWLDPLPLSHVVVSGGEALRSDGDACSIDFGVVESPGTERQVVRISNAWPELVEMKLGDAPPWLAARWLYVAGDTVRVDAGGAAELELSAAHDALKQTGFDGAVQLFVGGEREVMRARMIARRTHPLGAFDFHGSPQPRGFDFGLVDPLLPATASYDLSFDSLTSVPLIVAFSDLPAWLTFEVDGRRRGGPAPGRFFERAAPFKATIRPHCAAEWIGAHDGVLHLETNDPRAELRALDLRFSVHLEPARPFLRALPDAVRAAGVRPLRTDVRLENWGRAPARVTALDVPPPAQVLGPAATVPAARNGRPGLGTVSLRVLPARLSPGANAVPLTFDVEGGSPLRIVLPVHVAAVTRRSKRAVMAAAAALFALLALTVVIVLYLRVLS